MYLFDVDPTLNITRMPSSPNISRMRAWSTESVRAPAPWADRPFGRF